MARLAAPRIRESDIQGLKHFTKMRSLLGSLHEVGCHRDKASNRSLHFDEYCLGVLLFLFNPTLTSLRGIQQAGELKNVRKKLGLKRASLGSLSESVAVFDPEPLKAIATQLAAQVPSGVGGDFSAVNQTLTAVDGSVFDTVAKVAELAWVPLKDGKRKHAYRVSIEDIHLWVFYRGFYRGHPPLNLGIDLTGFKSMLSNRDIRNRNSRLLNGT